MTDLEQTLYDALLEAAEVLDNYSDVTDRSDAPGDVRPNDAMHTLGIVRAAIAKADTSQLRG